MDNETDELLNSILTGTGDTLLGIDGTDSTPDFDQQLLSPADSSSSGNSGNTGCQSVDLIDMFANGNFFKFKKKNAGKGWLLTKNYIWKPFFDLFWT